jgi:hypothetical protein
MPHGGGADSVVVSGIEDQRLESERGLEILEPGLHIPVGERGVDVHLDLLGGGAYRGIPKALSGYLFTWPKRVPGGGFSQAVARRA